MKKILTFSVILGISVFFLAWYSINRNAEPPEDLSQSQLHKIFVGNISFYVELADTPLKRTKGLSGRLTLQDNTGMLFVFEESDFHGIWMKNMLFPIDIIWIDESLRIVDIEKDARPESYPETFRPKEKAKYVLEVNAGFSDEFSVGIGDYISF